MDQRLTTQEIREFQDAFKLFDKNKDNRICMEELGQVMKALGQKPTKAELKALIKGMDIDGNGTIEFNEFLTMMSKSKKARRSVDLEEDMRTAFKVFDKDGNGFISPEELREAMKNLGENLTDKQLEDMINAADLNGDGLIDYTEFVNMMMLQMNK